MISNTVKSTTGSSASQRRTASFNSEVDILSNVDAILQGPTTSSKGVIIPEHSKEVASSYRRTKSFCSESAKLNSKIVSTQVDNADVNQMKYFPEKSDGHPTNIPIIPAVKSQQSLATQIKFIAYGKEASFFGKQNLLSKDKVGM